MVRLSWSTNQKRNILEPYERDDGDGDDDDEDLARDRPITSRLQFVGAAAPRHAAVHTASRGATLAIFAASADPTFLLLLSLA